MRKQTPVNWRGVVDSERPDRSSPEPYGVVHEDAFCCHVGKIKAAASLEDLKTQEWM